MKNEITAFEILDEISSAWAGKQIYFLQENGLVYGRYECQYMTLEEAVTCMAKRVADDGQVQIAYEEGFHDGYAMGVNIGR